MKLAVMACDIFKNEIEFLWPAIDSIMDSFSRNDNVSAGSYVRTPADTAQRDHEPELEEMAEGKHRTGIGLGIDAGGTYTDTVLYDFTREEVVSSSKAPTTHNDYSQGIKQSLECLFKKVKQPVIEEIGIVSLSTTLATNAIVEGKGGRVGLILIGYDAHSSKKISVGPKVVIGGKHSINGDLVEPIDPREAEGAIEILLREGVDAFAVSSEVGVRNPAFEQSVKMLIRKKTDMPVVCGSELTDELNCVKRANTCYFNARLLPLVARLLESVHAMLEERNISAPIMVVKGDGTLMSEEVAHSNPIEMVLSGPAASVIGGAYLSNIHDGYVVDIGGTTTDAAYIKDGFVGFKEEGIHLRGFKTAVKTMNVHTFGLGGDSYIRYSQKKKEVFIGPERVVPICYLASEHPEVVDELRKKQTLRGDDLLVQPAEFFLFQKEYRGTSLHPQEKAVMEALRNKSPMSRRELSERVDAISVALIRTERLETYGNILRSALTPTDVLHAIGSVSLWNVAAAKSALSLYAERAGMKEEDFVHTVLLKFYKSLLFHLFEFWFAEDGRISGSSDFSENLSSHLFSPRSGVQLRAEVNKPIVFIGAPAQTYARGIEGFIGASIKVPVHHGVANAVGAVIGVVRVVLTVLIRPLPEGGYTAYTKESKKYFDSLDQAKEEMKEFARRAVREKARRSGALHLDVKIELEDREVKISQEDTIYLETVIKAMVSSIPVSGRHES